MLLAMVLIVGLPRRQAIVPFLLSIFLLPMSNSVVLGGVHFFVPRLIIMVALTRVIPAFGSSEGILSGGSNPIDRAFLWCAVCQAGAVVLLFGDVPAIVNQIGYLIDSIGAYVVLRYLIRSEEDIWAALKCFAVISFALGVCMFIEQIQFMNLFYYLGGGRAIPEIRDGKIRSQALFLHPLLAGTFGATLLPVFILLWKNGKAKVVGCIGIVGSSMMTLAANSSSPILAYAAGILGLALWPIRTKMRIVRWCIVGGLVGTAILMKAPVWFILAHIDLTGSSSGYHRAALIDQFVNHFTDWWLIGVKDTGSWGWDMWDAQNQYVSVGETGGLAAFVLFIVMIVRCYKSLGNARQAVSGDRRQEWTLWLLGSALFSHLVAFFGVNYFDVSQVNWFALLALISAASVPLLRSQIAHLPATSEPAVSKVLAEPPRDAMQEWWSSLECLSTKNSRAHDS
jgi:hypothetical protein